MNVNDALNLIDRLNNLPAIYDRIEAAVCGTIHRYYDELFAVESIEAEILNREGFNSIHLAPLLEKKIEIHKVYWSNHSLYYIPCSACSSPRHVWNLLTNIEILQNGDDENPLYIFKARVSREDGTLGVRVAFVLKLSENQLFIEHEYFG